MIKIRSRIAGFRRCGAAHPAVWTEYPDDRFTREQLARLEAEPMLQVEKILRSQDTEDGSQESGEETGETAETASANQGKKKAKNQEPKAKS